MDKGYLVAVSKDSGNKLKFPSKCAYCLASMPLRHVTVKHNQLKRFELKVPYCETHAAMIRRMKLTMYVSLGFGLLVAVVLAKYFHMNRVFMLGAMGFNYIAGGIIGLVVIVASIVVLRFVVLWYFPGQGSLDQVGAVDIVEVYSDGFVVLFDNKAFGIEFSLLNQATPIARQK
jgi:hypothetical protein